MKLCLYVVHLGKFGSFGSYEGQFSHPWGVCAGPGPDMSLTINNMGEAPIHVEHLHMILRVICNIQLRVRTRPNTSTTRMARLSLLGASGNGTFTMPIGLACDPSGHLHVCSHGSDRILVFTSQGQFIRCYSCTRPLA